MGASSTKVDHEAQAIPDAQDEQAQQQLKEFFQRSESLIKEMGCWTAYSNVLKCISEIDKAKNPTENRTMVEVRSLIAEKCPKEMACKITIDEEDDQINQMIKKSGCWNNHTALVDCMNEKQDFRQCQNQLKEFKQCMLKNNAHQYIKKAQEDNYKAELRAQEIAPKVDGSKS